MSNETSLERFEEPKLQVYVEGDFDTFADRGIPEGSVCRAAAHRAMLLECLETPITLVVLPEDGAIRLIASLRRTFRSFQKRMMEALIYDTEQAEEYAEKSKIICSTVREEKQANFLQGIFQGYLQAENAVARLVPENELETLDKEAGVLFPAGLDSYSLVRGQKRPKLKCYEYKAFQSKPLVVEATPYYPHVFTIVNGVLKKYEGIGGAVVIPDGVTSIDGWAFRGCSSLTSVTIPDGVKEISWGAFESCSSLTSVTIPESVTEMKGDVFRDCSSLTSVSILSKEIDCELASDIFAGCTKLQSFSIPVELKRLGKDPFGDALPVGLIPVLDSFDHIFTDGAAKKYVLNEKTWNKMDPRAQAGFFLRHQSKGLTEEYAKFVSEQTSEQIGAQITGMLTGNASAAECAAAGYFLSALSSKIPSQQLLNIHAKLKREKNGARAIKAVEKTPELMMKLHSCAGDENAAREAEKKLLLKNFRIENGEVKQYIGKSIDVVIPEGVLSIGKDAFKDCSKIVSVTIPEGVTSIGEDAFYDCTELRHVALPESIREFGKRAFVFCSSLTDITIPGGAEAISFGMFGYCRSLKSITISEGVKRIEYGAFLQCRSLKSVTIPESVTSIGEWAFQDCSGLTSVSIPKELNAIGEGAFICCNNLVDASRFVIVNGILFDYVPGERFDGAVVIPEGVTRISCRVFYDNSKVKSVVIPEGVTSIGEWAFRGCGGLTSVTIPKSVTSIGKGAFRGCSSLRHVSISGNTGMDMLAEARLLPLLDEAAMGELIKQSKDWEKEERDEFYRSYLVSDTRAAMLLAEKRKELDKYAALRGVSVDELRDRHLSDLGLDKNGCKRYDLGNQTVTVRMLPDFSFDVVLPDGKTAKSLPKKGADSEKYDAANKDYSQIKKDSRKVWKNRADLLLQDFISGKERPAAYWKQTYDSDPILHGVACLLVWEQGGKSFLLTDGGLITADGSIYELTDELIRLAHPIEMDRAELASWQRYFTSHGLKQPFAQIWERAYRSTEIEPDRYAGCPILFFQLQGAEKHGFNEKLEIPGCQVEATWSSEAAPNGSVVSYCDIQSFLILKFSRAVNHALAYLDRVTITGRIAKDDADVMRSVEGCNIAQIMEYIAAAQKANAVNVLALLLEYKNKHFADFDPMDEFTLE